MKSRSSPSILLPKIILEEVSYERIGNVLVRKSQKRSKSKKLEKDDELLNVNISRWDPGTSKERISDFKLQMGTSKYAKMHKINEAQILKAASKKESKLSVSQSVEALAMSGSQKLFTKVSPPT